MNRAYKLVWNTISASWVVASELAKGRKKSSSTTLKLAVLMAAGLSAGMASAVPVVTLPTGESVASGSATFDRTVLNQLTVNQSSSKLITNWNSFDVSSGGKVIFAQPDASSIALNRVTSGSATQISGQVSANGQLVIVNPNGITFGAGSQVSASGIVASSLDILDSDFNTGTLVFSRGGATGTIDNQGSLTASAGSVSLLAPLVKSSGTIVATGGNASLINADAVNVTTVDPAISIASTVTGLIQHSGSITATQVSSVGGKILLTGDTSQAASQIQLAGTLGPTTNTNVNGRSILVNGDVNLNGATNSLDLTSTDGYSLTNGAAVNLNGASSGFSVNGTAYTVIRDVTQLQAMNINLAGNYALAGNIDASDTANWNGGAGFFPVGNASGNYSFIGVLDGLGHSVSQLNINRPTISAVGLIGYATNSSIRNIGLKDHVITGNNSVGALVGFNTAINGGVGTISNSYASGTVTLNGTLSAGGLVGSNFADNATLSITGSYAAGNVTTPILNASNLGGLVGFNYAISNGSISISNTYAAVSLSANVKVSSSGGLVGYVTSSSGATASIANSYAAGSLNFTANSTGIGGLVGFNFASSGTASIDGSYSTAIVSGAGGGLVGTNNAANTTNSVAIISNSFWDTQASGQSVAVRSNSNGTLLNLTGLTTAGMRSLSSFSSWGSSIDAQAGTGAVWRIYDGQSAPLLRTFLKPLNAANTTKTYDATAYTAMLPAGINPAKVLGTAVFTGNALGAINAGTYNLNVSGLYSVQDGYDIANAGTLTINKAALGISSSSATKTYDGTTSANASAVISSGSLFGSDSISGGTFAFADKNAGTGKHVIVSGVTVNDGNNGGNYDVTYVDNTSSTINKRLLTITAQADSKEYDGKLTATANAKPVVTGRQRGDSIVGLTQSYLDKNAGTGKTINVDAGYTIRDGNGGNNYNVVVVNSNAGVITPKALTISTVANSKVYDGGVTSANKPVVTGLAYGDRVTGLFQQYETKTVGTGKKLLVKSGYVVNDGNGGNNYTVTEQGSNDGVITVN